MPGSKAYTQVFLIALGTQALARWDGAEREKRRERQIRKVVSPEVSQEAWLYEHDATIESRRPDLHRQVDTPAFVFAERETLSTCAASPPPRKRLAAHPYQHSSQARNFSSERP